jgi:YqaJ-like viral recombinase domain
MAKKATAVAPAEPKSQLVILDVAQGSEEWFRAKMGMPSASNFSTVMANGKDGGPSLTRTEYLYRLAGEIITERPAEETFKSRAMERGKEMEPQAIADYEQRKGVQVRRVGLGINFSGLKRCCASPDGLVGFDGGLETKTMRPDLMIPLLDRGARMPAEHRAQVMGNMLVFEKDFWDFKLFYPRMPDFTVRVYRDDSYIKQMHNQIEIFNHEKNRLVEKLRSMGAI